MIAGWRIEIVATDLSGEVLERARVGLYTQFEVQRGLPIQLLIKHFAQDGELWQIAPEIRAMVKYRQLNLLADFLQLGTFDLVFCRNVLIYFDQETKIDVLDRLARVDRRRRLSDARRRGNGGRADRPLQDGARQTRSLCRRTPSPAGGDFVRRQARPRLVAVDGGRCQARRRDDTRVGSAA